VLDALLRAVRSQHPTDRVVIVSNFAKTLDLVEGLCVARGYPTMRLDGSTPAAKRTDLVARFNDTHALAFAFLLSAGAGGLGLTLTGANRLVSVSRAAVGRHARAGAACAHACTRSLARARPRAHALTGPSSFSLLPPAARPELEPGCK
jgi:hypothetical protein